MATKSHAQTDKEKAHKQQGKRSGAQDLDAQVEQMNAATALQRARVDPNSLPPHDMLQLQRTVGNQGVGQLLTQPTQRQPAERANVIQREDDDMRTMGGTNPTTWSQDETRQVKSNMWGKVIRAKARALELAYNGIKRGGGQQTADEVLGDVDLSRFETTRTAMDSKSAWPSQIAVEQVYTKVITRGAHRIEWTVTIDLDDPPWVQGGQSPHVGYTVVSRPLTQGGPQAFRENGHVWLDMVPAGR
jgi:hypothetical protein